MRGPIRILLLLLFAALIAAGCTDEGTLLPSLPPETYLFVGGGDELQATHYIQVLSWHAEDSDSDRDSLRFEYRWTLDPSVSAPDFPTDWVGVERPFIFATRDTFYLPVPTAGSATVTHSFEIRAVDLEGNVDLTPAVASFPVFNQAPRLLAVVNGDTTNVLALPDSTLPVLNLEFMVLDPDNIDPENQSAFIKEIRFWFEDENEYLSYPGDVEHIRLEGDDFGEQIGIVRELHIQAIDKAEARSNVLEASVLVRDIRGSRVLLLDSAASATPENLTVVDPFWREEFSTLFQERELVIHDFSTGGSLGHPDDIMAIFSLFEAVIWYNGIDGSAVFQFSSEPTPEMQAYEAGLVEYVETGGKVCLSGLNLLGADEVSGGSFSADFEADVLMVDSLYVHDFDTPGNANTSNWWILGPVELSGFDNSGTEDLGLPAGKILMGVDRMSLNVEALQDGTIEELYRLRGSDTYPGSLLDGAVGVRRRFDSGGQIVVLSFPLSLVNANDNRLGQAEGYLRNFGILR